MRTRLIVSLYALIAAVSLAAQGDQSRQPTFRAGANYVRVDMYAMQDGRPVHDIRREEIELLEDGVPQTVEDFEHVLVRSAGPQETRREPDGLQESREAAGDPRARVFVIFLDTYHTQMEGSAQIRGPLVRFLDRVLGADDLVALMTPEMSARDIALGRKTTVISNVLSEEWWGRRGRAADDDPKHVLYRMCAASMGLPERAALEMIARRREKLTLDALDDLVVHLAGLRDERKAVVTVTEGWLLYRENPALAATPRPELPPVFQPPVRPPSDSGPFNRTSLIECEADRNMLANLDHEFRLREITDAANRSNVTFYPVHPRGLVAMDAPIGPDKPPASPVADAANLRTRLESMRTMAIETDGDAVLNTNNIDAGLKRISDDLSSYYLLGYYSTNTKLDGRFRTITVRIKRPGVRVRARRGYRGRTAEELASSVSPAANPERDAVAAAFNTVAGLNSRSNFRIRPTAWARPESSGVAGTAWIVGELDYRMRKELAWTAGAEADITVVSADGTQVASMTVAVPGGQGTFGVRVPESGSLAPGEYAVRVRLRPGSDADLAVTDTARLIVPDRPSTLGEAVMWRRGPTTGPQYVRTADPRFQRSERLRLELAAGENATATARPLDRLGKPLQVPVTVTEREDAATGRWVVADATLAPLAAGDYAIEVTLGDAKQITGFRVVP